MVVTLLYDSDKKKKRVLRKYASEIERGDVIWTHLQMGEDKVLEEIMKELGQDAEFKEDLLEIQRPRFNKFKDFQILIIAIPSKQTIDSEADDLGIEQIAFIIRRYRLISVSRKRVQAIEKIMKELSRYKGKLNVSYILSEILDEITENIIEIVDYYEDRVNVVEKQVLACCLDKGIMSQVQTMKENLFYVSKVLRANAEAIGRLMVTRKKDVVSGLFNRNIRNRMLYAVDSVDTVRVTLNGIVSLYLSQLSQRMNEAIYRLTILGTVVLIPTLVSGLFGMNVPLPNLSFWQITISSILLSVAGLLIMRALGWI